MQIFLSLELFICIFLGAGSCWGHVDDSLIGKSFENEVDNIQPNHDHHYSRLFALQDVDNIVGENNNTQGIGKKIKSISKAKGYRKCRTVHFVDKTLIDIGKQAKELQFLVGEMFLENLEQRENNGDLLTMSFYSKNGSEAVISYRKSTKRAFGAIEEVSGNTFVLDNFDYHGTPHHILCLMSEITSNITDNVHITPEQEKKMVKAGILKKRDSDEIVMELETNMNSVATVSITFHYSPQFKAKYPDVEAYAKGLVEQANRGYKKNKIPIKMELHCVLPVNWSEEDKGWKKGRRLLGPSGEKSPLGYILEQFDNDKDKARVSADMAMVLVAGTHPSDEYRKSPGAALSDWFSLHYGFTIGYVYEWGAMSNYVFDHEVAHMYGAYHNRERVRNNPNDPNAFGMLIQPPRSGYRTILAYSAGGHMKRIQYYSSSTGKWTDPRTGQIYNLGDENNDNRDLIIRNRFRMSRLGNESISCAVPLSGI